MGNAQGGEVPLNGGIVAGPMISKHITKEEADAKRAEESGSKNRSELYKYLVQQEGGKAVVGMPVPAPSGGPPVAPASVSGNGNDKKNGDSDDLLVHASTAPTSVITKSSSSSTSGVTAPPHGSGASSAVPSGRATPASPAVSGVAHSDLDTKSNSGGDAGATNSRVNSPCSSDSSGSVRHLGPKKKFLQELQNSDSTLEQRIHTPSPVTSSAPSAPVTSSSRSVTTSNGAAATKSSASVVHNPEIMAHAGGFIAHALIGTAYRNRDRGDNKSSDNNNSKQTSRSMYNTSAHHTPLINVRECIDSIIESESIKEHLKQDNESIATRHSVFLAKLDAANAKDAAEKKLLSRLDAAKARDPEKRPTLSASSASAGYSAEQNPKRRASLPGGVGNPKRMNLGQDPHYQKYADYYAQQQSSDSHRSRTLDGLHVSTSHAQAPGEAQHHRYSPARSPAERSVGSSYSHYSRSHTISSGLSGQYHRNMSSVPASGQHTGHASSNMLPHPHASQVGGVSPRAANSTSNPTAEYQRQIQQIQQRVQADHAAAAEQRVQAEHVAAAQQRAAAYDRSRVPVTQGQVSPVVPQQSYYQNRAGSHERDTHSSMHSRMTQHQQQVIPPQQMSPQQKSQHLPAHASAYSDRVSPRVDARSLPMHNQKYNTPLSHSPHNTGAMMPPQSLHRASPREVPQSVSSQNTSQNRPGYNQPYGKQPSVVPQTRKPIHTPPPPTQHQTAKPAQPPASDAPLDLSCCKTKDTGNAPLDLTVSKGGSSTPEPPVRRHGSISEGTARNYSGSSYSLQSRSSEGGAIGSHRAMTMPSSGHGMRKLENSTAPYVPEEGNSLIKTGGMLVDSAKVKNEPQSGTSGRQPSDYYYQQHQQHKFVSGGQVRTMSGSITSGRPHVIAPNDSKYPYTQQSPHSHAQQPSPASHQPPPASHHQPPPASHHQPPPASHHQPPPASHQPPPASHHQPPPASHHQPPPASHHHAASSHAHQAASSHSHQTDSSRSQQQVPSYSHQTLPSRAQPAVPLKPLASSEAMMTHRHEVSTLQSSYPSSSTSGSAVQGSGIPYHAERIQSHMNQRQYSDESRRNPGYGMNSTSHHKPPFGYSPLGQNPVHATRPPPVGRAEPYIITGRVSPVSRVSVPAEPHKPQGVVATSDVLRATYPTAQQPSPSAQAAPKSGTATGRISSSAVLLGNHPPDDVLYLKCNICSSTYGSLHSIKKHLYKVHEIQPRPEHLTIRSITGAKQSGYNLQSGSDSPIPASVVDSNPSSSSADNTADMGLMNGIKSEIKSENNPPTISDIQRIASPIISQDVSNQNAVSVTVEKDAAEKYSTELSRDAEEKSRDKSSGGGDASATDKSASGPSKMTCHDCGKQFPTSDWGVFKRHMRAHDQPNTKCQICKSSFTDKTELEEHYEAYHNGIPPVAGSGGASASKPSTHTCTTCSVGFSHPGMLTKHIKDAHRGMLITDTEKRCLYCDKEFSQIQDLMLHSMDHEKKQDSKPSNQASSSETSDISNRAESNAPKGSDASINFSSSESTEKLTNMVNALVPPESTATSATTTQSAPVSSAQSGSSHVNKPEELDIVGVVREKSFSGESTGSRGTDEGGGGTLTIVTTPVDESTPTSIASSPKLMISKPDIQEFSSQSSVGSPVTLSFEQSSFGVSNPNSTTVATSEPDKESATDDTGCSGGLSISAPDHHDDTTQEYDTMRRASVDEQQEKQATDVSTGGDITKQQASDVGDLSPNRKRTATVANPTDDSDSAKRPRTSPTISTTTATSSQQQQQVVQPPPGMHSFATTFQQMRKNVGSSGVQPLKPKAVPHPHASNSSTTSATESKSDRNTISSKQSSSPNTEHHASTSSSSSSLSSTPSVPPAIPRLKVNLNTMTTVASSTPSSTKPANVTTISITTTDKTANSSGGSRGVVSSANYSNTNNNSRDSNIETHRTHRSTLDSSRSNTKDSNANPRDPRLATDRTTRSKTS